VVHANLKSQQCTYPKGETKHFLRFTINVCNNQSNSLHVQNEKETNNEAGNEHTPTTMLHELILNDRLKKHSYPQLKTKSLIPC